MPHGLGEVKIALGIGPVLGAMVATGFPFLASDHSEMGTMAGEGPAVVEGPYHRDVVLPDVVEQHGNVDKPAVEIVQVDQIRLKIIQLPKKLPGSMPGKTADPSGEPGQIGMGRFFEDIAGHDIVRPVTAFPCKTAGAQHLISPGFQQISQLEHDAAGAAVGYGVNLQ